MVTATDMTIEHYQRPEIREVILSYCRDGDGFRALNGDDGWYKQGVRKSEVSLTTPEDYDSIIIKHRTIYATLDFLESSVRDISGRWDKKREAPEKPIGALANCLAFTPSVDIDSIKGPGGEDITTSPEIKAAVEAAAQFFVDYLREHGITKSVHCLYSGGGIYVHLHHGLFRAKPEWTPEDREYAFRSLTMAYNALITDISGKFFEAYPELLGKVKFDPLNNQKRKFKTIFSIHKRLPVAVVPLDPEHIEIEFSKARMPLSSEVLAEGKQWYRTYDLEELPRLKALLKPFMEQAEEELKQRKARTGSYEISRRSEALSIDSWPPCMKNILEHVAPGKGPHRALAVLASFLYQAGWAEEEAFMLWKPLADRAEVETRIFDCWYGQMSCPNCVTIQKTSDGYPRVGLGGLGYCQLDEKCKTSKWPGEHSQEEERGQGAEAISEEELLKIKVSENPRFKTSLESDNFIQEYIGYGETVTDGYSDYWFAGGLFCLSVVANRNVVIKLRQGPIYSNVWINELGLSSISRKSTGTDKTDQTIAAANIDPDCKMPDEFSPEAMIERLDQHPRAYLIKDESAGMLAVMKKDYMRGLKDALMQLFDGKDINRELRTSRRKSDKTKFRVRDPYLCLMLATTPGSFAANTELLDITSGWLPRFLHFFPNHPKDRWMPLEEGVPENDILSTRCHARLIKVKQIFYDRSEPVTMHLSKEADAYFKAWQKVRESELVEAKDDRRAQFYSRLAVYVLKIGMLFTIGKADYSEEMEISLDHIKEACRLVDEYFMPMAMTVADLVGKAADKNNLDKVMAVLTSQGGKLKRRELGRKTHLRTKDLDETLESLKDFGEIQIVTVSNPRGEATIWVTLSQDNENRNYSYGAIL